jgi:enamine deaminase RidA (YjgF/YER057c/UK114 family)
MTTSLAFRNPATFAPPVGFSHVVEVRGDSLAFIAGQVPRDSSGSVVGEGNFRAQVEQVFANLNAAIDTAGGRMTDIVKLNYYCMDCVDQSELPVILDVLGRYCDATRLPAGTFVFVRRMIRPEWLIEIDAVIALAD